MDEKNKKKLKKTVTLAATLLIVGSISKYTISAPKHVSADDLGGTDNLYNINDTQTPLAAADNTQTYASLTAQPNAVAPVVTETPVITPAEETPVVEEPVIETPVVVPPVVEPPVVEPPVVEPPVVEPPVVEPPVVEPPVEEAPQAKIDLEGSVKWLENQLNTDGTTAHDYFATRAAKTSLDSNGKNFAPDVNAAYDASGLSNGSDDYAWRVYKQGNDDYNIFFSDEEMTQSGQRINVVRYNTVEKVMVYGTIGVIEKTVEGSTFFVIDGGSFIAK